jgi:hypothetical protein
MKQVAGGVIYTMVGMTINIFFFFSLVIFEIKVSHFMPRLVWTMMLLFMLPF